MIYSHFGAASLERGLRVALAHTGCLSDSMVQREDNVCAPEGQKWYWQVADLQLGGEMVLSWSPPGVFRELNISKDSFLL